MTRGNVNTGKNLSAEDVRNYNPQITTTFSAGLP
jgi:hypothetical protein